MHGDVSHESKVRSIDPASKFLVQDVEPTRLLVLVTFMCMYQVYPLMFRDIF